MSLSNNECEYQLWELIKNSPTAMKQLEVIKNKDIVIDFNCNGENVIFNLKPDKNIVSMKTYIEIKLFMEEVQKLYEKLHGNE